MPEQSVTTPGFYGKLPLSGDFVSRGEEPEFVRLFDPWLARHIAPRIHEDALWPNHGLRFMLAAGVAGATGQAGVILPSHDRTGRWFPLVCNTVIGEVSLAWGQAADDWFAAMASLCEQAAQGSLNADDLERAIAHEKPPTGQHQTAENPMFLWCAGAKPIACSPDAPDQLLDALILIDSTGEMADG